MTCHKCGACCIAPSINTAIPNMPGGKPVGMRCANLNGRNECLLFGRPERPTFCLAWPPFRSSGSRLLNHRTISAILSGHSQGVLANVF
jgi:hypothetical protein